MNGVPVELYQDLKTLKSGLSDETSRAFKNYGDALQDVTSGLATIPAAHLSASEELGKAVTTYGNGVSSKAATHSSDLAELIPKFVDAATNYDDLSGLIQKFSCAASKTNKELATLEDRIDGNADTNYAALSGLVPLFIDATDTTNEVF